MKTPKKLRLHVYYDGLSSSGNFQVYESCFSPCAKMNGSKWHLLKEENEHWYLQLCRLLTNKEKGLRDNCPNLLQKQYYPLSCQLMCNKKYPKYMLPQTYWDSKNRALSLTIHPCRSLHWKERFFPLFFSLSLSLLCHVCLATLAPALFWLCIVVTAPPSPTSPLPFLSLQPTHNMVIYGWT